ncbi:hypothetical protein C8R47DRAFT_1148282 [Mycena vitilis]|nr:hypothetical protein C8R47DRAFT_1148282 [Mycena vitilis]
MNFLVTESPEFWSSYLLKPGKRMVELNEWQRRFGTRGLRFHVRFDNADVNWTQEARASFSDTLAFLVRHAPSCTTISVAADDARTLPATIETIRNVWFHRLQSFTLIRCASIHPYHPTPRQTIDCPFVGNPNISELRMFGAVFHWRHMVRFGGLTVLVLHDLYRHLSPNATQLLSILSANPALVRASLRLGTPGVLPYDSGASFKGDIFSQQLVELRFLVHLDLSPHGDDVLPLVLAAVDLPALKTLSVVFSRRRDVHALLSMGRNLATVTSFIAIGYNYEVPDIGRLFRRMPAVLHLEISDFNHEVVDALLDASSPSFRFLRSMVLEEVSFHDLRHLVAGRTRLGVPLERLCVSYPMPELTDAWGNVHTMLQGAEDKAWLIAHVRSFKVDSGPSRLLQWILH